jgi:hypothetical protein
MTEAPSKNNSTGNGGATAHWPAAFDHGEPLAANWQ